MNNHEAQAHPTRSFRDVFVSIGEKHIRNPVSRSLFLAATGVWRKLFRIDAKEQIVFREFAAGRDGFRPKYWIFKSYFYPDYNATFVLTPTGENAPARSAAQMVDGALKFREDAIQNRLEPEFERDKPLDMAIYQKLFSRVALTKHVHGRFVQQDTDFEPTDYIVVFARGFPYRLKCIHGDKALSYPDLHQGIAAIIEHAKTRTGETPGIFGMLTAFMNKKHGRLLTEFAESNGEILDIINAALFTLSIDLESKPETTDATLRAINCDNYLNRDNRRSMCIVVTGNGRAGIIVNPHTGVGGVVSARFTDFLYTNAVAIQQDDFPEGSPPAAEPLELKVSKAWEESLFDSKAVADSRLYPSDEQSVFTIAGVGHNDFRARKISSDASVHCALNLAYLRSFGKMPTTGNFISLRNFKHGDIYRYVCSTEEMDAFMQNPGTETMRAAIDAHRALVKEQKKAEDDFYQVGMMLLKLVSEFHLPFATVPTLILILSLFIRDFVHRFLALDLWASQIPTKPGLAIAGRGSVFMSFIQRDSLAGHYMIYDDHIDICFLRSLKRKDAPSFSASFVREMERSLHEVKELAHAASMED
jgi:hypothetical protein